MERRISRGEFLSRGAGLAAITGLGLGGLVGCGQEDSRSSSEPIEIEYWHVNTDAFGGPAIKELMTSFQERNPNIKVRTRYQDGSYTGLLENAQTALASDTPPDVAQIGYLYLQYVAANFPYAAIDELAGQYAKDDYLSNENFAEDILALGRADDNQVGMPYSISNSIGFYNADMITEAGADPNSPPGTWEEWREVAQAVRDKMGKPGVYVRLVNDNWDFETMIESNGAQMLGCQDGNAVATFDSPEAAEAIEFWAGMIEEDLCLNVLDVAGQEAFLSEEVAVFFHSISGRETLQSQAGFNLKAAPYPSFGSKKRSITAGGNNLVVFSQDSAKREAAWKFVEHMLSPESLTTWTKGTGYVPPRNGVADDPKYLADFIRENPAEAIAMEQLELIKPWTSFPGPKGLQASKVVFDAVQTVLGGEGQAQDTLSGAAEEVNRMIEGEGCT